MHRNGSLSEADKAVWAAYARFVLPLPGRTIPQAAQAPLPTPPEMPPPATAKPNNGVALLPKHPAGLSVGTHPAGLDAATWHRFRTGRLAPSRRLDLHGFTAQRAHSAVSHFLKLAQAERVRCVEIVTGRGEGEGGVLRRELPIWLDLPDLRPLVLAATHPHPANPGSIRILLRRLR